MITKATFTIEQARDGSFCVKFDIDSADSVVAPTPAQEFALGIADIIRAAFGDDVKPRYDTKNGFLFVHTPPPLEAK